MTRPPPCDRRPALAALLAGALAAACGASAGDSGAGPGGDPAATKPAITTQPASRTVTAGQTATFTVVATGTPAPTYRWQRNGADLSGARAASYTTPATTAADSGATFRVVVANSAGAVTSAAATLTVTAAAACTRLGPTGSRTRTTTDGSGATRSYLVEVPSAYPAGAPLALTFVFHGAGDTSTGARGYGLQDAPGAAASSIFVYPQGVAYLSYGVGWNDLCDGYDMVFFDHMVAELEAAYCVDPARIYVAGFSWGCDFVTALACCRGDVLRGIAAASCSDEFGDSSSYLTYANLACPRTNRAGIRFTHDVQGDGAYSAQQFASTSALYRYFNGCAATSSPASPAPCVSYGSCRAPVVECAYANLSHSLPAGWAAESWAFLAGLP